MVKLVVLMPHIRGFLFLLTDTAIHPDRLRGERPAVIDD
jgi:hypothetical protein